MNHVYMFQWNIPKENHVCEWADRYLNIIATWDGETCYSSDGKPIVFIELVNPTIHTCIQIKNWLVAERQIKEVATMHFAELARQERINKARAELIAAGEIIENPIMQRYEPNTTITLTDDLPY